MARRFVDTEIWKKKWYRTLQPKEKCFLKYIWDNCNNAGIWEVDMEAARYFIGEDVGDPEKFLPENIEIVKLENDTKWFLPGFLKYQYPNGLNSNKPIVIAVRRILEKNNLSLIISQSLGNDYLMISQSLTNHKTESVENTEKPDGEKESSDIEKVNLALENIKIHSFVKKEALKLIKKYGIDNVISMINRFEIYQREFTVRGWNTQYRLSKRWNRFYENIAIFGTSESLSNHFELIARRESKKDKYSVNKNQPQPQKETTQEDIERWKDMIKQWDDMGYENLPPSVQDNYNKIKRNIEKREKKENA
jgi:hypothetical protein